MNYVKKLIGDTVTFTWINSGVTMNPKMTVYTGSETIVNTGDFVDSGAGHYYYKFTVESAGYYNMVGVGSAGGYQFKRSLNVKGVTGGVD